MEAEQARQRSHTSAERMRIATESARANAQTEADSAIEGLQESIEASARLEREAIDKAIEVAANSGRSWTNHRYSERISASRNTREDVAFIETIVDATTAIVVESLQTDGYEVTTSTNEERDYRDNVDAQPEYYETYFSVKW